MKIGRKTIHLCICSLLSVICLDYYIRLSKLSFSGHYFLQDDTVITISREDLVSVYQANNYLPVWTFNTSLDRRIRFHFNEFGFYWNDYDYNLLDIGDGSTTDSPTRLATFGGRALPSNVTSVSNSAWLKINGFVGFYYVYGIFLNMTIGAVAVSGMYL